MKVLFTGRGFEITPSIKNCVNDRLQKLSKYLDEIIEAHAFLIIEKYRHKAEINVHTRRHKLAATVVSGDMYDSVTAVFGKLETQAKKLKEKRSSVRKRNGVDKRATVVEATAPVETTPTRERIIRMTGYDLKPMSVEDAALRIGTNKSDFLVFRNTLTNSIAVVYKRKDGHIGLIEPEL